MMSSLETTAAVPPPAERERPSGEPGRRLGKYRLLQRLAAGGMAEIFLSRVSGLPGFQKTLVIKRILPHLAEKDDFVAMFLDEARIAATLHHPNIVQTYDVGLADGHYFMALEYLHGEDLRTIWRALESQKRRMPLAVALHLINGIAAGLHYAHEKIADGGRPLLIIHRDVSPQNTFVTYNGGVKLLDFGLAKAQNRFNESRAGTVKGKVSYMSPEQCRGEELDRRTDIFSLGVMLYEVTVWRRLYSDGTDFEIMKRICESEVPAPRDLDPDYPPELERIVMRALAKDRDRRYSTVRELQQDLEAFMRERQLLVPASEITAFMESLFGHRAEPDLGWSDSDSAIEGELSPASAIDANPYVIGSASRRMRRRWATRVGVGLAILLLSLGIWRYRVGLYNRTRAALAGAANPPVHVAPAPHGLVEIATTPPGAVIFLDGRRVEGRTPLTLDKLESGGEHVILIQMQGYREAVRRLTLAPREVAHQVIQLEALPEATPSPHPR